MTSTFLLCTYVAAIVLAAVPARAGAQSAAPAKLGDHPAVVVQRLQQQAGYDYASKFYPHPAWLYLYSASPDELAARAEARKNAREMTRAGQPPALRVTSERTPAR